MLDFHVLLSVFAAGLLVPSAASQPSGRGDNLLVLIADDVGVDNVGVYAEGPNPPPTPNIDALAASGVLFRNAWSNPLCSPTRACLQTGRYSFRTFVGAAIPFQNGGELLASEWTVPEVLDAAGSGYAHAAIGKWHLTRQDEPLAPNLAGWSYYAGLLVAQVPDYYRWPRTEQGVTQLSTTYSTTQMVDDALAWIGQQTGPWVCYLAFNAAHFPFQAPPAPLHSQNLQGKDPTTEPIPFYKATVEAMDTEIGRLLSSLGPSLGRTNILFFGDNGTERVVSEPPFLPVHAKGTPYEGGLNVPLIVSGPAVQSPGREEAALVGAVDLFATMTELAGVDARSVVPSWIPLDSVSLVPYLENPGQPPLRSTMFAERFRGNTFASANSTSFAAIRNATHKLIRWYGTNPHTEEFYDLVADPFETTNLLLGTLTPTEATNWNALSQELTQIRSPAGAFGSYGATSCVGSNGNPAIGVSGKAAIGHTCQVSLVQAPPLATALLFIGPSQTSWKTYQLPYSLEPLGGGPGCFLYSGGQTIMKTTTDAAGSASVTVSVPYQLSLVGTAMFQSWVVADPAAPSNTLGLTTSDGTVALLGL